MLSFKTFINEIFDPITPLAYIGGAAGSAVVGHYVNKILTRKSRKKRQKDYEELKNTLKKVADRPKTIVYNYNKQDQFKEKIGLGPPKPIIINNFDIFNKKAGRNG